MSCGKGEISLKQIADLIQWKNGPTSTAINHLISKGLLEKQRHGFYIATKSGEDKIREIIENVPKDNADYIVCRAIELFTANRFDIVRTIKYDEGIKPTEPPKKLVDVVKKIYLESVSSIHRNDFAMVRAAWQNHKQQECDCGFDYTWTCENNAKYIEQMIQESLAPHGFNKDNLFVNLRYESFSCMQKCRKLFGLSTTYTEPQILEEWY